MSHTVGVLLAACVVAMGIAIPVVRAKRRVQLRAQVNRLRRFNDEFAAALLQLVRQRYRCTDDEAADVRRRFDDWRMDDAGIPYRVAGDGSLVLDDHFLAGLDHCARECGLTPGDRRQA